MHRRPSEPSSTAAIETRNKNRIGVDYARSLRDLTFNSKPIINHLTMLAHENIDMASIIVPVIEDQLSKVHASMKLPTLYLIDSICKNIGQPYIDLFSRNIVSLFLNVYASLPDVNLQNEFVRVLRTWDNVMSLEVIQEIHLGLSKTASRKNIASITGGASGGMGGAPTLSKQQSQHHLSIPPSSSSMFNGAFHSHPVVSIPPSSSSTLMSQVPSEMWQISGPSPSSSSLDSINQSHSATNSSLRSSSSSFESINRHHYTTRAMGNSGESSSSPYPPSSQFGSVMIPHSYNILPHHGPSIHSSSSIPSMTSSSTATLMIPVNVILEDLRMACSQPSNRYDPLLVVNIMNALENSNIDRNLFMEIDSRARIPDKRVLIELLSSILTEGGIGIGMGKYSEYYGFNSVSHSTSANSASNLPSLLSKSTIGAIHSHHNHPHSHPSSSLLQEPSKIVKKKKTSGSMANGKSNSSTFIQSPSIASMGEMAVSSNGAINSTIPDREGRDGKTIIDLNSIETFVDLTYEDIQKSRPHLYKLIYDFYALQCKNCGFRFPDNEKGRTQMATHLDAHFRRNMRLKDRSKKILAREWAMKEEDWNQDVQKTSTDNQASSLLFADSFSNVMPPSSLSSSLIKKKKEAICTTVSAGNDITEVYCPDCKEKLEIKWDDDKEEWVYQNAIKKGNNVYHADCITVTK